MIEFGQVDLCDLTDEVTARTEAGIRAGLLELPDGQGGGELLMDIDGLEQPQPLKAWVSH
ncbi:MAG: hypothetical protein Ct9H300mP13_7910 [Gammaproteobacteria bacterium]|nr:MAG: hypothetical protein Ct9H300mP13_7910 [Gammaproteobacteria bacterium]